MAVIETLGYGVIRQLSILAGQPCLAPAPEVLQWVKLDSGAECQSECGDPESAVKKPFQVLFRQLHELREATVDVEFRHSVPFRLTIYRHHQEWDL
jgi:hypothetical protein